MIHKRIKCFNCGEVFEWGSDYYKYLLAQFREDEFEKEIEEKLAGIELENELVKTAIIERYEGLLSEKEINLKYLRDMKERLLRMK